MLASWKKSYDQPKQYIKKQRHYFANKGPFVKAMVFSVVMYGCEIWTIKKAEHQKIDTFELWWWRRLLRVPWIARRSNQLILKEINSEYSLEELMLKLQYFGHLMGRTDSLGKTLMPGKIEGKRRRGWQVGWHHQLDGHESEQALGVGDGQGSLVCCNLWGCKELDMTERLNRTELMLKLKLQYFGHMIWRTDSFDKTLMLGKIEGRRRRGHRGWDGWMASPTWWAWVWASSGSWWWTGKPGVLQSVGSQRAGHN